jgi:hypothetical protein
VNSPRLTTRVQQQTSTVRIRLDWPESSLPGISDNFFLGVWHPHSNILVQTGQSATYPCVTREGTNWFLASAESPLHPSGTGLTHYTEPKACAVAFRGYVHPALHSYSPPQAIVEYWHGAHRSREHNGIFSAAVIDERNNTLSLITDHLGIGTLYYRTIGEAVLFSSNPRYLTTSDTSPDLIAWRSLLQTSWILADRTLSKEIRRVPAGSNICFTADSVQTIPWFDFHRLPEGTRPVGTTAVSDVEEVFRASMHRCLQLGLPQIALPLSSGFDSRRILADLHRRKVDFLAITCKVLQKEHRDLDARFASTMANDFQFPHRVVESDSLDEYLADDRIRRALTDGETYDHTWALRVMAALPRQSSLLFDGVGGDILGDPVGWKVHLGLEVTPESAEKDLAAIIAHALPHTFDSLLSHEQWPETDDLRSELTNYLRTYLPRRNISEIAFLLLRQRRAIALWSQQLLPPGHVAVYPYFDLEYLQVLLDYASEEKHRTKFQRACLREYYGNFYKYPGNRDIPTDIPPGSPSLQNERHLQCYFTMCAELRDQSGMRHFSTLLTTKGKFSLSLSQWNRTLALRHLWYLQPLAELVWKQRTAKPCWVELPPFPG